MRNQLKDFLILFLLIRSRSNDRDRDRSRSRSRSRSRDKDSRSKSSRSRRNRHGKSAAGSSSAASNKPVVTEADLEGKTADEQEMMKAMGFCGFETTKNKKVDGNDAGEVHVILKRKYRQYMNRKGGFNRPLDFVA